MSISSCSIFGSPILMVPKLSAASKAVEGRSGSMVIESSSRPKKKATAHHRKTRPRKSQPWDINRKPTLYPSLPPLPPDWTLLHQFDSDASADSSEVSSTSDLQAPIAIAIG